MPVSERDAPGRDVLTVQGWLARYPYLQGAAALDMVLHTVVTRVTISIANVPAWSDYSADYHAGIPLLQSGTVHIDGDRLYRALTAVLETLASTALPGMFAQDCQRLHSDLHSDSTWSQSLVTWLLGGISHSPKNAGLLRYLCWTIVAHSLEPLVNSFAVWRDEEKWLRNYCPTCGSVPAMAQLVGIDSGRLRLLFCGHCHTRWRYPRAACPFCETTDDHRLMSIAIEGEGVLRIDYCDACRGYLKTYVGEGNEEVFLADWSSIHLDILASDRGLERDASSLFQL